MQKRKQNQDTFEQFGDGEIARAVTMDRAGLDTMTHTGALLATNSRDIALHAGLTARGNDDYL